MKRLLGLDVGDKTIGVAISDLLCITAQGVTTIKRKILNEDLIKLIEIINEYKVETIVIGLPKNMNGTIGLQGEKVTNFGNYLKKRVKPNIIFWDERLSSKLAENILLEADVNRKKRKEVIDKLAAQNILQSYIDSIK